MWPSHAFRTGSDIDAVADRNKRGGLATSQPLPPWHEGGSTGSVVGSGHAHSRVGTGKSGIDYDHGHGHGCDRDKFGALHDQLSLFGNAAKGRAEEGRGGRPSDMFQVSCRLCVERARGDLAQRKAGIHHQPP
jgi:hypothetical protein